LTAERHLQRGGGGNGGGGNGGGGNGGGGLNCDVNLGIGVGETSGDIKLYQAGRENKPTLASATLSLLGGCDRICVVLVVSDPRYSIVDPRDPEENYVKIVSSIDTNACLFLRSDAD